MSLDLEALKTAISKNLYNPQNIFRDSMKLFADGTNNAIVPVNTTNPFVNLMMYSATQSAINNDLVERSTRLLLPEYANTREELSPHFDYNTLQTIHALPSSATINLVFVLSEVVSAAMKSISANGFGELIIPRDSVFTYKDGTKFGLYHDIMIRIINGDTMDIYYINNDNPLKSIDVPIINYSKKFRKNSEWSSDEMLVIPIEVWQFDTTTSYHSVTSASGLYETLSVTDQLYHVSVKTKVGGNVVELLTAHGDFKYNPNSSIPTAILQYKNDDEITIRIPDVYIDKGMIGSEVAITLYQTKGNIDIDMVADGSFNFVPDFINTNAAIDKGVNALRSIVNLGSYSISNPSGGMDMPTVDELRQRVILGNTDNNALTEDQLRGTLSELGYDLSHQLNYIGANVFMATNKMTDYLGSDVSTTVGSASTTVVMNSLIDKYGILNPTKTKVVVTPKALISGNANTKSFLTYSQKEAIDSLDTNSLVNMINDDRILTPIFYYLLDTTTNTPKYGAFDMDNPTISEPAYMDTNPVSMIKVASSQIFISKVEGSYYIDLLTTSNDSCRALNDSDLMVQLSTEDKFGSLFSINAKLKGRTKSGEFLFRAELQTNFNLDLEGTTEIINLYNDIYDSYNLPLTSLFYINYVVVSRDNVSTDSLVETKVNAGDLPSPFTVVTLEETTVSIGRYMDSLFTPIKSSVGAKTHQKYEQDILKYWESDVYETDATGTMVFYPNPEYDTSIPASTDNPPLLFNKIHSKGDPVMSDGEHEIAHYKGDLIRDSNNDPIPMDDLSTNHLVTLQTLDYKFVLVNHLPKVQAEIKANIDRDIKPISKQMIQDSELQYSLSNTVGDMEVVTEGSTIRSISNEIVMMISIKVSESTYKDGSLRGSITSLTKKAVADHLNKGSYIENGLIDEINDKIKSSVISFKIDSISSLGDVQSFHLVNSADSMGIKSILSISDTGVYEILDGIDVKFIKQ